MRIRYNRLMISVAVLVLGMTGCGTGGQSRKTTAVETDMPAATGDTALTVMPQAYNKVVKVVVTKQDLLAGVIWLQGVSGGEEYTLTYGSGLVIRDKYGQSQTTEFVKEGDVTEAYINDKDATLAGLCYSSENWEFQGSENWKFDTEKSELYIGKTRYYYTDNLKILSDGQEITTMDLNESDVLNIQGCGKKILSVTVERGHGYVKLDGIDDFVGGWVEIGKVIKPISKDMLIVVPEGNWDVKIVKDGYGGSLSASVERNQECCVDFSEVASEIVRYGTVEFTIEPEDAILYIAGREVDWSKHMLLEYDTYKIRVSADGYEDYTGNLVVEKALVGKKITLTKQGSSEEPESTQAPQSEEPQATASADVSGSSTEDTKVLLGYKININGPENVQVYFDDAYVGVSPVSFTKMSGTHTITFRKDGYTTKSYSVEIGTEEKDVSFDLPELVKELY